LAESVVFGWAGNKVSPPELNDTLINGPEKVSNGFRLPASNAIAQVPGNRVRPFRLVFGLTLVCKRAKSKSTLDKPKPDLRQTIATYPCQSMTFVSTMLINDNAD